MIGDLLQESHLGRLRFLALALLALVAAGTPAGAAAPDFERDVAPILVKRCLECHNERHFEGGLVLAAAARALAGGDSGAVIVAGKPAESYLLSRVETGEMPPLKMGQPQKLAAAEIDVLRQWIAAGARWPEGRLLDLFEKTTEVRGGRDWWSLQMVRRVQGSGFRVQHEVAGGSSPANAIDAFVLPKLAENGMTPAPQADRRTLIRRMYFDVVGMPPDASELEALLADVSPDAHERLVDRLLASPHFGERYARHWLDVVRFAETSGYERDQEKPHAWKYRDWVVQAFNDDKPYDEFIVEQLAGDELPQRDESTVVATGFLRLGTWNDEPNDPQEYKYERLEDLVHATSSAFLGLTVKCARCHDHKFDPIWQTDYYRMAAAFWAGPIEPRERELLGGPSKDELGYDVLGWTDLSRDPPPLHLLKKGDPRHPADEVIPASLSFVPSLERPFVEPTAEAKTSQRRLQLARWIANAQNPLTPRVIVNRLWLHHFGQGLVRTTNDFGYSGEKPTHPELLDWLASELISGPLEWSQVAGYEGVRVSGNDDRSNTLTRSHPHTRIPSAVGGWDLKRLHRLMLNSATYRQASLHPQQAEYAQRDAGNQLWWHAERRRLDAESLRDAMLAASGQLDLRMGGKSFRPTLSAEALEGLSRKSAAWQPSPPREQLRRSIYMVSQRSLLMPLMTTFDFSDTTLPCGQRDVTTVAPQALALLNNSFVHEQSTMLARLASGGRQLTASGGRQPPDARGQIIEHLWRRVFGRLPSDRERAAALAHLAEQEKHFAALPKRVPEPLPDSLPVASGLALHLRGDAGVTADDSGRVSQWQDQSPQAHHASQPLEAARPVLVSNAASGHPVIRFDGQKRFLKLAGQVLTSQQFTILAVVSDAAGNESHRAIFSNWNGTAGNSVTSAFLGLTGESSVRLSDDFAAAGAWPRARPFFVTAVSDASDAAIGINGQELARKGSPLPRRNLTTAYVIGQQGNIDGEYFTGDIAELVVYNRALNAEELAGVERYLMGRYQLVEPPVPPTPAELALASLCHVLLNTNEFIYVD
ncbi:MAG TPA: DUF1549 domain-containing protein [Pirellulaceae bacterium]|nr:DUF1549 domain-containing protein [Pirellulaceae bacterium]